MSGTLYCTGDYLYIRPNGPDSVVHLTCPKPVALHGQGPAGYLPASNMDFATKLYVDTEILAADSKLTFRPPVYAVQDENVASLADAGNGDTLVDGVDIAAGFAAPVRLLLVGQTDLSENGIYNATSVAGGVIAVERADDTIQVGMLTHVTTGSKHMNQNFQLQSDLPLVLDVDDQIWVSTSYTGRRLQGVSMDHFFQIETTTETVTHTVNNVVAQEFAETFFRQHSATCGAIYCENNYGYCGIELENAGAPGQCIYNMGISTGKCIPKWNGDDSAASAWYRADTRTGEQKFSLVWRLPGSAVEQIGWVFDYANKRMGIGTTTPDTVVQVESATETQLRLTYSAGLYTDVTTLSTGNCRIQPNGAGKLELWSSAALRAQFGDALFETWEPIRLRHDATIFTDIHTDAGGVFYVHPTGNKALFGDGTGVFNLQIRGSGAVEQKLSFLDGSEVFKLAMDGVNDILLKTVASNRSIVLTTHGTGRVAVRQNAFYVGSSDQMTITHQTVETTAGDLKLNSTAGNVVTESHFLPDTDSTFDLGTFANRFRYCYFDDGDFTNLTVGGLITNGHAAVGGNCVPTIDDSGTVGAATFRWNEIYCTNATINTSDIRMKKAVTPIPPARAIEFLRRLRPVTFQWKNNAHGRTHTGLIAQEVRGALKDHGVVPGTQALWVNDGERQGLRYGELHAYEISALQDLDSRLSNIEQGEQKTEFVVNDGKCIPKWNATPVNDTLLLQRVVSLEATVLKLSHQVNELLEARANFKRNVAQKLSLLGLE